MRKFYTQLFLVVLLVTLYSTSAFAQAVLFPEDNSTDQLVPTVTPGDQTLTITFDGDAPGNTVKRLDDRGVISLNDGPGGTGIFQQITLQIGQDYYGNNIEIDGNSIVITFAKFPDGTDFYFEEDAFYYVTVSDDAIVFQDDNFFAGLGYSPSAPDFDAQADWGFKVKDITPPKMVTCTGTIHNGQRGVDVAENVVHVCFDEPVYWVGGSAPDLASGDIAFYHATNPEVGLDTDPNGEYGGDVLYATPYAVYFSGDVPSGSDPVVGTPASSFGDERLDIWVKYAVPEIPVVPGDGSPPLKYAGIGDDVWPVNADIYMRFLSGLIEDKDGNIWTGTDGSPWDPYTVDAEKFWFTTRDDAAIAVDIWNIVDGGSTHAHGETPLWDNEDFTIEIGATDLRWKSDASLLRTSNNTKISDLLEVEINGNPVSFTIRGISEASAKTYIRINPASPYSSGDVITVRVLGGLVRDLGLVEVEEYEEDFTCGDYDPPVFDASINNVVCTNFDLRTANADEAGEVWYALVDEDYLDTFHPAVKGELNALVTIEDIERGYVMVDNDRVATNGRETPLYFNNVADPDAATAVYGNDNSIWVPDYFNIDPTVWAVTYEHIDDFVAENHGKIFRLFYFGFDPDAEGPFAAGFETLKEGRATEVSMFNVELTDCLPPEHEWFFEGVVTNGDPLWDPCDEGENIKKQGKWNFKVANGNHVEELFFVDPSLSWGDVPGLIASDVFTLEVSTVSPTAGFTQVEIADIQYANDQVIITPLNSYPSGGWARITVKSGSIMDESGNATNEVLSCTKQVETYCDPYIATFTVDTKSLMFPGDPIHDGLNGVVALVDGTITVTFNNPMFIPKVDEDNSPVLEEIGEQDNVSNNYSIEEYIRIREGDETGTSFLDVLDTEDFAYVVTRASNGGVTKVEITPTGGYEFKSENWYYVEVEETLQDENRRELAWEDGSGVWDNNIFVDPHHQFAPYTLSADDVCEDFPADPTGNSDNYFMRFRTEDTVPPVLMFTFNKEVPEPPLGDGPLDYPYVTPVDEDLVSCVTYNGPEVSSGHHGDIHNGIPIGVIITEWSQLGFDLGTDYYVETDPNGLRDYFTFTNDETGEPVDFDIVVLELAEPDEGVTDPSGDYNDFVWFGFRPFVPLDQGVQYSMTFTPLYVAPDSGIDPGSVFIDDNGNELIEDDFVSFITCVEDPEVFCVTPEITIEEGTLEPSVTLTFDRPMQVLTSDTTWNNDAVVTISGGGDQWESHQTEDYAWDGPTFTVEIPWSSFNADGSGYTSPDPALNDATDYTLTVQNQFYDIYNETMVTCITTVNFTTPDITPPYVTCLSPDLEYNVLCDGSDSPGTYNDADDINPRNPGMLEICFDEGDLVDGKLVEIWEWENNVSSKRWTFTAEEGNWSAGSSTWTVEIPADELNYESLYFVDVQSGFVVDEAGNEFPGINYGETGTHNCETWTFETGEDTPVYIVDTEPGDDNSFSCEVIDPNLSGDAYENLGDETVRITEVSFELSEACAINDGSLKVIIERNDDWEDIIQIPVSDFTSADGITWTAETDFVVDMAPSEYSWIIPAEAFAATDNPLDLSPQSTEAYCFYFEDFTPPEVMIWPVTGDEHVAFNTHGYVRFSESVIARDVSDNELIVTQQNLKSWIKVYDVDGSRYLTPDEYVCEFIDLERQHVRITFLDENAPAIAGVTANLIDENRYTIEVNASGDGVGDTGPVSSNGYDLQDAAGNVLIGDSGTFDTEDITPPNFYVTTCDVTAESIEIVFTPWANENPHLPTVRTYPAEAGTVYFIVLPADATPPTADQLFNKTLANVEELDIPSTGSTTYNWDLPDSDVPPVGGYNFKVYAVMKDNEIDVFVSDDYGNPWIADYPVFGIHADYPIGIEDIRPAPNQNMDVKSWEFCACDDDAPDVVSKEWHENRDVPVDETFEIKFDEMIQFGSTVNTDGQGTGGLFPVLPAHEYGYEVRLRQWDNNVAVPIAISYADSSMVITPVDTWGSTTPADLEEETRYYIEIDRWVIRDTKENCLAFQNPGLPQNMPPIYCSACPTDDNFFDGWVGRWDWEFNTHDATPPELIAVSPQGCCVENDNDELVFTFTEKNEMILNNLGSPYNSIYIYKVDNRAIPFEIIPLSSASAWSRSGDTWTISFPTNHTYNSEELYEVEWHDGIFTDNAAPEKHKYTIADDLLVDGTPGGCDAEGVYDDGGDAGAPWDMFRFQSRDNLIPSVNWAVVSTLWQNYEGQPGSHEWVYQIPGATGTWDINDPEPDVAYPVSINECGSNLVPHTLAFYVWTDEDVQYTDLLDLEDAFFLEVWDGVSGWDPVSIEVVHNGEGAETLYGEPGGIDVDNDWWQIRPVGGELDGSTTYRFGIVADTLEDVSEFDCEPANKIPGQELFNFCTWNTDPAVATLRDNCMEEEEEIAKPDYAKYNPMDMCVCEEYIDLCFDKMVVKTANDGAGYPVAFPGAPWFTYANLLMNEADLMDTDGGHYIDFREVSGAAVEIESVEIFVNGTNVESGEPCFCGEGVLCYRLHVKDGLDENTHYTFEVKPDVLKDQTRVPNGNLFPGQQWQFKTRWNTAPYITDLTPFDGEENVLNTQPLIIEFNRDVTAGEGRIIVRDNANPQGVVLNVAGTDDAVSISDNVVTVLHPWFADNTTYYVEIKENFVYGADCDEIGFEGTYEQGVIDDEWDFSTGDVDGPNASLWPNQNPDDYTADCVAPVSNLILTFDENVYFDGDCGELVIYKAVSLNADGSPAGSSTGGAVYGDVVERITFSEDNFPQLTIAGTDPANGLTRNEITVIPSTIFESGDTYYVRIEGNGVDCDTEVNILSDILGNEWFYPVNSPLPGIHYNDWWFKIDDDTAPELVSVTPERNELLAANQDGTGVTTDLVMEFDMEVWAGEGTIQVVEFIAEPEGGDAEIQRYVWAEYDVAEAVANGDIEIAGNIVTIKDVYLLDNIDWYYVIAEAGTFTNTVPCILKHWEGIYNPDVWLFSTDADVTCPALTDELVDSDALDEMYEDPSTVNFTLTFSENICLFNGERIAQILDSEGAPVAEAAILPAHIEDNVLSLTIDDFDAPLIDTSMYTLYIPANSIHDFGTNSVYGMHFDGDDLFGNVPQGNENYLCEAVSIDFYTGDFTPPGVVDFLPVVNCLENENEIWVEFSEPVQDGDGFLRLVDADGVLDDVVLDAADDEDAVAETVTFTVNLPDSTNWYVVVEEGFVTDFVYMSSLDGPYANVALDDPSVWTFGIDDNTVPVLLSWETPAQDIDNLETTFEIVLTYDDFITAVDETVMTLTTDGNAATATLTAVLGPEGNQVTVTVVDEVADQTAYMLELAEGFAADDACGNANLSLDDMAGPFTVGDRTDPVLTDRSPVNVLPSYIGVEIVVDFFDDSDLTVELPFVLYNSDDEELGQWSPDLTGAEQSDTWEFNWEGIVPPIDRFGTFKVVIPAGAVVDVPNGNAFAGVEWSFSIVDNVAPDVDCLTIISPEDGDNCVENDIVLEMEFCERMTAANDDTKLVKVYDMLEVQGTLEMNDLFYSTPVTEEMVNLQSITIPVSGLADNTSFIVLIDEGAMTDEAGNDFVGIYDPTTWNFTTGDNTPPEVVLVPAGSTNNVNEFVINAHFTEPVLGAVENIMVESFMVEDFSAYTVEQSAEDELVYNITITADDKDTITITVPQTEGLTDVNCNFNPLLETVTGEFSVGDNTPPTVEVTAAPAEPMNTLNDFTVELTFSEEVQGVADALAESVGLDSVKTDDNMVYTLYFSGDDETEGSLLLDSEMVNDVSVNENELVEGIDWPFMVGDHVAPTAVVDPEEGDDLRVDALVVTVTFDEEVIVPEGGIEVTGGEGVVEGDGMVYTVTITGDDHADITLALTALITDDSYNANPLEAATYEYNFGDRTAPVVTVDPAEGEGSPTSFVLLIVFNEDVTGVDEGISVTGGELTLSTLVEGRAYKATLTGDEKATLVLSLSDAIEDLAGNALVPGDFTYTIGDFTAPTVAVDPASLDEALNTFTVDITFDEEVLGVSEAVTVEGGSVVLTTVLEGISYQAEITADDNADVVLGFSDAIEDLAGNALVPVSFNYHIGCNNPEVREATVETFIGETVQFTDEAAGIDEMLAAGEHVLTYLMDNGCEGTLTVTVVGVPRPLTVAEVQGETNESPWLDAVVIVEGTVTGVSAGEGFFMQDDNAAWSGIWVEYSGASDLEIGDGVAVTGVVGEVSSVTTLNASEVVAMDAPVTVTAVVVDSPSAAKNEMYESVLVQVEGARAKAVNDVGEWVIYYELVDDVVVNDWFYAYTPVEGNFHHVTGIVNGRMDAYKLEPRMESDVVDVSVTSVDPVQSVEFKVYPNPFHDYINIDNHDKLSRVVVTNIAGQRVIDIEYPTHEIRTANLVNGVYVVSLFTEDGLAKTERIVKR